MIFLGRHDSLTNQINLTAMDTTTRLRAFGGVLIFFITAILPFQLSFAQNEDKSAKPALDYSHYPTRFYHTNPFRPDQKLLLRFSKDVKLDEISSHFRFYERKRKVQVPVKASRPTAADVRIYGKRLIPDPKKTGHLVVIQPAINLEVGHTWHLSASAGLTDVTGQFVIRKDRLSELSSINPFEIRSISAVNNYDEKRYIQIHHNKYRLTPQFNGEFLTQYVDISPLPENYSVHPDSNGIILRGDFEFSQKIYRKS